MKFKKVFLIVYSLSLLIFYIKSDITPEKLELPNEDSSIEELNGNKFYHVIPPSQDKLPNYLKITVQEYNSSNFSYGNRVISYYQTDKNFKERKQLSQNNTNTVVIWLNKDQFKKDFYLSIEFENPCDYFINITYSEYIDLFLDEKITYYVNEENKEMNFLFKLDFNFETNMTIWAKGDKEISSTLSGIDSTKHSNFNSYLIRLKNDTNDFKAYLKVTGKVGDLINVGSALFMRINDKNIYFSPYITLKNNTHYGFIKKGLMDNNCFISDAIYSNYVEQILVIALDHDYSQIPITRGALDNEHLLFCINFNDLKYDELFYSFSFIAYIPEFINSDIALNSVMGVEYSLTIPLDKYAGFIPIKPTENFKFLTFSIRDSFSNKDEISECSIYTCDNYPLCSLDSNDKEKNLPIKKYNEYYDITFTKDELGTNYSPINKEQKLIKIKFKKKSSNSDNRSPEIYVNIYTDKSYALHDLDTYSPVYKLMRKDQFEKAVFKKEDRFTEDLPKRIYFLFEKITGDISIDTDFSLNDEISSGNKHIYKNFDLFDINLNLSDIYSFYMIFNITAKKDSVFTYKQGIIDTEYLEKGLGLLYELSSEGNYIFKFDNKNDIILNKRYSFANGLNKIINLFSPNCKISVKNINLDSDDDKNNENINLKYGFFQAIYSKDDSKYLSIHLEEDKNKEECMLYVSNNNIPKDNLALNYSINLDENFPQSFAFNKDRSLLKFEYYFVNQKDNINIEFNLLNKGKYTIKILVENEEKKSISNFDSNSTIDLKPDNWNNICTVQQKCNLSFTVLSEKTEEESYLQITIKRKGGKDGGSSDSGNSSGSGGDIKIILIVILSIVCLIIIIALIIFLVFKKKKEKEQIDDLPEENEGLVS